MSERPNDTPDDAPSGEPEPAPAADVIPDTHAVMDPEVASDGHADGGDPAADAEGADDLDTDEALGLDEDGGAYAETEPEEVALEGAAAGPARPMSPSERKAARAGLAHGQLPIDPALRIKDRASSIFVLLTVGVFAVILANALVFGHGGLLSPLPTPTPIPTVTAAPSATPAASLTPAPSATAAPTASPSAS